MWRRRHNGNRYENVVGGGGGGGGALAAGLGGGGWVLRRYGLFFGVALVILAFQLYLGVRFFALSADTPTAPKAIAMGKSQPATGRDAWPPHQRDSDDEASVAFSAHQQAQRNSNAVKKASNAAVVRLRVEELDFVPACEITAKEAVSAVHRARTQRCKQHIANVTCLIQKGLLYPDVLPNRCPNGGLEAGKSLGCFKDEKNFRLLSGYYGNNKQANSPQFCIRLCLQSGFPYAGVQYS